MPQLRLALNQIDSTVGDLAANAEAIVHWTRHAAEQGAHLVAFPEMAHGTPRWIDSDADVEEVLSEMQSHRIRRLPVIEDKRLVGMISEADLARHLTEIQIAAWAEQVYAGR